MSINDKIRKLNREGYIPGPEENYKVFFKRVRLTKEFAKDPKKFFKKMKQNPPFELKDPVKKPDLNWVRSSLLNLYDIYVKDPVCFFSSYQLRFFQAAATWALDFKKKTFIPLLQIRKNLQKGEFLKIYDLGDILAHEFSHFARIAFFEEEFEEFFAYFTSSNLFRKFFGPIIKKQKEIYIFFSFLIGSLIFYYISFFFDFYIFNFLFKFLSTIACFLFLFSLFRLLKKRIILKRCIKKLFILLKDRKKAIAITFRLTDKEIKTFAKAKIFDIKKYIEKQRKKSFRWKMIYISYFL